MGNRRLKGNWHIVALAVAVSIITVLTSSYLIIICYILWLGFLFYRRRLGAMLLLLASALLSFFLLYIPAIDSSSFISESSLPEQNFAGRIVGPVEKNATRTQFTFEDYFTNQNFSILYFPKEKERMDFSSHLKTGATCEFTGEPELPDPSTNPGEFNYRYYLSTQKITHQVYIDSLQDISCAGQGTLHRFYTLRTNMMTYLDERLSDTTSAWMKGLVLGDDSAIPEETIELFQRWSLSHLLAISGLHVGLFVAFLYFFLVKCNVMTKEKAQWLIVFLLPAYAIIAGGEPSIWRASTMVICFIFLRKAMKRFSYTDVLSFVFLLLVCFDPYLVYHVGFQLSFLVTFGLLLSQRWIAKTSNLIIQGLKISFVAQMMILPILFHHFYTFQPLSILMNTLIVPYFSIVIIPSMFFFLLVSPFPIISPLDKLFVSLQELLLTILTFFDDNFYYPWSMGWMSIEVAIMYYGLFLAFMYLLQNGLNKQAFLLGTLMTVFVSVVIAKPYLSPYGRVTMLDIGQGDSFVIELPYRRGVFIIDAGAGVSFPEHIPTKTKYKRIIQPYLNSRGIYEIDALIVTHQDVDHSGSIPYLIKDYNPKQLIISDYFQPDRASIDLWEQEGLVVSQVKKGDQLRLGSKSFHVLAPMVDKGSPNENSIVLYGEFGGKSWLFTGDISKQEELELIDIYPSIEIDVLKVAHHGSSTSSDEVFLTKIKPDYSLISVGRDNRYGHPTNEVIETLEKIGTTILRTDDHGAVQYIFKEENGTFYKFLP
ncbi:DNA internalization-related competence protein ComEC/Rec2 [Oceanobacillus kapialis]|uniref:DNA internalization-related competence protein ComEC/Rec2 n=1 Tax=Oceanobacillus kapialis TaxID=481353 RepID=A0ABW5Q5U2_9BACI